MPAAASRSRARRLLSGASMSARVRGEATPRTLEPTAITGPNTGSAPSVIAQVRPAPGITARCTTTSRAAAVPCSPGRGMQVAPGTGQRAPVGDRGLAAVLPGAHERERDGIVHSSRGRLRVGHRRDDRARGRRDAERRKKLARLRRRPCVRASVRRTLAQTFGRVEIGRLRVRLRRRDFEQPLLVAPVRRQERERVDGVLGREEVRDAAGLQRMVHVGPIDRAQPRAEDRLGGVARDGRHRVRRLDGADDRARHVQRDDGIGVRVGKRGRDHGRELRGLRVAAHVDRIRARRSRAAAACRAPRPCPARSARARRRRRPRNRPPAPRVRARSTRSRAGRRAGSCPSRGCAPPRTTACTRARAQYPPASAPPSNTASGAMPGSPSASVSSARSSERPALSTTTGLVRAAARSADRKAPRFAHALDVEQDAVGHRVVHQRLEQLAESDVDAASERHHRREAHLHRAREIEHRRADGARLRDEREPSRERHRRAERRVEPDVRAYDPERARPEQPDAALPRDRRDFAPPRARRRVVRDLRERHQRGGPDLRARVVEDPRHRRRRGGDDREVDRLANRGERRMRGSAEQPPMVRIDGEDVAVDRPASRFSKTVRPSEPVRSDAPTSATDFGVSSGAR